MKYKITMEVDPSSIPDDYLPNNDVDRCTKLVGDMLRTADLFMSSQAMYIAINRDEEGRSAVTFVGNTINISKEDADNLTRSYAIETAILRLLCDSIKVQIVEEHEVGCSRRVAHTLPCDCGAP